MVSGRDSKAETSDSGEESDVEMPEMLATSRERRPNAGAKMGQMINEEEEDDFYQTTYGGFFDVSFWLC